MTYLTGGRTDRGRRTDPRGPTRPHQAPTWRVARRAEPGRGSPSGRARPGPRRQTGQRPGSREDGLGPGLRCGQTGIGLVDTRPAGQRPPCQPEPGGEGGPREAGHVARQVCGQATLSLIKRFSYLDSGLLTCLWPLEAQRPERPPLPGGLTPRRPRNQ